MGSFKAKLLSGAVITSVVGLGVGVGVVLVSDPPAAVAQNPCAAENPCAAASCNPCAVKGCNPCAAENPCAAASCNPCAAKNPCAAMSCNPCNPCAAENPCAAMGCNPCAAKNPCAAMGCNPCAAKNPCAAMSCNPCAANNPCNPCNPCAAGEMVELSTEEATSAYGNLMGEMTASYSLSGNATAAAYSSWAKVNSSPYPSNGSHGSRYLNNYVNEAAQNYASFEDAGVMAEGAIIAKDSFDVSADGTAVGPLFLMEKMAAGFNESSGDWRYTMIMPNGSTFGVTGGEGAGNVQFCIACHAAAATQDHLYFLPEEFRVN